MPAGLEAGRRAVGELVAHRVELADLAPRPHQRGRRRERERVGRREVDRGIAGVVRRRIVGKRQLAQQPAQGAQFSEDLRAELRLLSRTIAAALGGSGTNRAQ